MKKTLLLIVIFIGVLVCAVGYSDIHYRTALGEHVPGMQLERAGSRVSLKDLEGRYVILNFWNSTDATSRRAANLYTAWIRSHPTAPLEMVSVNFDENPGLFSEIVRRDGLMPDKQYRVSGDTARAVVNTFGLKDGYGSMLIGPDGTILAHNPTDAQLTALVH